MPLSKLDKINAEITRTKSKIDEFNAKSKEFSEKLSKLEKEKIEIENAKIIALYRKEKFNEDEFAALLKSQRSSGVADNSTDIGDETDSLADDSEDRYDSGTAIGNSASLTG